MSESEDEDIKLKKDMMEALASIQDPGQKVVLMLLARSMDNISRKLDKVLADEAKLKQIVLNGSAKDHDAHHRWIETRILDSKEVDELMGFVKDRHAHGGYCDYAQKMIKSDEDNLVDKRKVKTGVAEKIILVVLGIIAAALSAKYLVP